DGKIVARDLHGDTIKAAVAKALSAKPDSTAPATPNQTHADAGTSNPSSAASSEPAAPPRIPKSPETILAELRDILPEDWTCQLDLNPGEMKGSRGLVPNPLFRMDFTNQNIWIHEGAGSSAGPPPVHPHPYLRLYFLP